MDLKSSNFCFVKVIYVCNVFAKTHKFCIFEFSLNDFFIHGFDVFFMKLIYKFMSFGLKIGLDVDIRQIFEV